MRFSSHAFAAGNMMRAAHTLGRMIRSRQGAGIANVDPEPLSHVAGEGIDLERDVAAHETFAERGELLPPDPDLDD